MQSTKHEEDGRGKDTDTCPRSPRERQEVSESNLDHKSTGHHKDGRDNRTETEGKRAEGDVPKQTRMQTRQNQKMSHNDAFAAASAALLVRRWLLLLFHAQRRHLVRYFHLHLWRW